MNDATTINHAGAPLLSLMVNESSSAIYVCDAETRELLFVNDRLAELTGVPIEKATGMTCYEYVKGRPEICEHCSMERVPPEGYAVWQYTSPNTGRHFMLRGRFIDWNGRRALIVYTTDETERIDAERSLRALVDGIPGGIGIFNLYTDGRLERVYLNDGFYELTDSARGLRLDYDGLKAVNSVMECDRQPLLDELMSAALEDRIGSRDIRVLTDKGVYKWLNIRSRVASKTADKYRLYVFYSDIDQLKSTQLSLETNRNAIHITTKQSGISLWLYDMDARRIFRPFDVDATLGYEEAMGNVPESILGTGYIHPADEPAYKKQYDELFSGCENAECTVRVLNRNTGKYEWQRMLYTRLHESENGERLAIGFSISAGLEQESRLRFEHELQLRRELTRDSVTFYQLNLTTGMIEEYRSLLPGTSEFKNAIPVSEAFRTELLRDVLPEYRDTVRNTLFSDALYESYKHGTASVSAVYRRRMPDGSTHWIEGYGAVMKKPDSDEITAFVYSKDIDEAKKDQLAVSSIMDEEIESVVLLDTLTWKAHYVRIKTEKAGPRNRYYDFEQYMKAFAYKQVALEDRREFCAFFNKQNLCQALEESPVIKLTYRVWDKNGGMLRKKARAFYLDDTHEDIIIVRRDITDLYQEEQRQKQALQRAVDSANSANSAKSDFLSRMSHDMRTPLNAILTLSGNELTDGISEAQKDDYLAKIHASGKYLLGIINDVLDMASIESKKLVLHPEPYSLDEFSSTINTVIGDQCAQKGIEFVFSTVAIKNRWVLTDKVRFNQLFINLLSNALKFTPPGGRIELIVEYLWESDGIVKNRFIVRDNGIGMSRDFLPTAFDSFSQENRSTLAGSNRGTGLGLTIVKQIVELMGGVIKVTSEPDAGTEFTVELEARISDPPASYAAEAPETLEGLRVLLCEDNALNAEITAELLQRRGCIVERAENGKLGLELFAGSETGRFDAILMDIRMPVMDGLAAAKAIRALERPDAKLVPIIALTADAFAEDARFSLDAGMDDHLAKPIDPPKLYHAIAALTAKRWHDSLCK